MSFRRFATYSSAFAIAGLLACSPASETPRPRNVLLLVVDTLRADRLGCYGYERPTSPEIDALALDGTLYVSCYSQGCWTVPSMISMMTGATVAQRESALPQGMIVLAEVLKASGMDTSAFPANRVLTGRGFMRGFDYFSKELGNAGAVEVAQAWEEWYSERLEDEQQSQRGFFSWVQFIDPHHPYKPAPEHDLFSGPRPDHEQLMKRWEAAQPLVKDLSEEAAVLPFLRATKRMTRESNLYDGEVRASSDGVGRILDALRASGELAETLVILASDHGEMLYEHRQEPLLVDAMVKLHEGKDMGVGVDNLFGVGHRPWFYDQLWNTPLILSGPGIPKGRRVSGLAANLDIFPTILEALNLAPPPGLQGQSLFSGRDVDHEAVHAYGHHSTAVRKKNGVKFWLSPRGLHKLEGEGEDPARFLDLVIDPEELMDFQVERPAETQRLRAELKRWHATNGRSVQYSVTAEQQRVLEDLGYIGAGMEE